MLTCIKTPSIKILRIALAVLGGLVLVLIVAAVVLINTFDPNSLKDNMTSWVQERTGRRLDIEQDIELSLFPWFAVETGGVSLSDDPAYGARDFVRIESLSARIRVWPLLRRQVEIGRVVLDGVELNLGVDATGRGNWSALLPQSAVGAPTGDQAQPAVERLAVEGIELRNTNVQWHDINGEPSYLVRDLRLDTGEIHDVDPVDLSLAFSLFDVKRQLTAALELEAELARATVPALRGAAANLRVLDTDSTERAAVTLGFDEAVFEDGRLRSSAIELSARLTDPPFGAELIEFEAALAMLDFDTGNETLAIDGLTLSTGGIEASVDVQGTNLLSAPQLSGELQASGATIAALFETLGLTTPPELTGTAGGGFTASAAFAASLAPLTIAIDRYTLAALGMEARGSAELIGNGEQRPAGGMRARIEVPVFRPGEPFLTLLTAYLPEGTDLTAISSASLAANLALPASGNVLELSEIALGLNDARLGGRLVLTGLGEPARIQGQITATGVDNALLGALLGNQLPATLTETALGSFRLATTFDYARQSGRAILDPLELAAYGIAGEGRVTIETAGDALRMSGQASLDPFSPRALLTRFDLPVPASSDPTALGRAELAASFQTTGSSGSFRDIALTLDDSRITGEFSVENFADPRYRFMLRADRVDADRYLPPKGAPAAAAPAAPASGSGARTSGGAAATMGDATERRLGDIRLANEALTATRLNGSVSVGDLTIGGMRFEQLAADLAIGDGRAALSSVSTQLYGGDFAGAVNVDTTGETPALHLRGAATELAMDPLLRAMLGASHLSGTGNFELDLTGRGETIGQAMATAAGSMNVSFREGELRGVNLGHSLCKAVNAARQLPAPAAAPEVTPYQIISASAAVAAGTASTQNLYASTGYLELTGQGSMRLVDQTLDTSYVTRLIGPVNLAGCERLNSRVDGSIPIGFSLKGQLPSPDIAFDIAQLIEDLIRREIRNQAEDAVRDRLEDRLRDLLQ